MTHLDDESLALLALGDASLDTDQREHVQACAQCKADVAALARVVRIARDSGDVEIVQPPAGVWDRIHAELGLPDEPAEAPAGHGGVVTRLRPRAPATRWWLIAAALVIGAGAGVLGSTLVSRSEAPRVVADAVLKPFPTWSATGSARVEENATGSREVVVDLSAPGGGLREVWLIDPDTSGLVSLGLLNGTTGTFHIPADLDLRRYSVVDVSEEPDDGNPAHSGNSIVRGSLAST